MSGSKELVIDGYNDDISDEQLAEIISRNPNLERLRLFECSEITRLPILPVTLKELSVDQCDEITLFINLPGNLEVLDCDLMPKLKKISSPPLLTTLVCRNCEKLSNIDISMSHGLQVLDATNCENLSNIIGDIPQSLERIIITETVALQPETAQKLLDYYHIKDAVFRDEHSWWPRELPPIADRIRIIHSMGISKNNLFEGGKVSRKHKRSKRINTGKRKGSKRRRTKKIKRRTKKIKINKTI
jgi:hypothetical protein